MSTGSTLSSARREFYEEHRYLKLEKVTEEEMAAAKHIQFVYPPRLVEAGGLLLLLDQYEQVCQEIESDLASPESRDEGSDDELAPQLALLESVVEDSATSINSSMRQCRSRLRSDLQSIFEQQQSQVRLLISKSSNNL